MAAVAEGRGVEVLAVSQLHREVSPVRDLVAAFRLAGLIRRLRPHVVHTHTAKAGAVGRVAVLLAGVRPRPIVVHTFHGHVLRGYFGPLQESGFRLLERLLARGTDALVAVSPQVRDDLVGLGVAPAERFVVVRLGIELEERVGGDGGARARTRRLLGVPDDRFLVGWIGPDDRREAHGRRAARVQGAPRPRRRRRRCASSATAPTAPAWRSARTSSASRATSSRSATRTRSRTGTPPSTS